MYEEFYGFDRKPFGKTPDPSFLYPSREHEEALARLQYGIEERELTLLTGEIGTGKTLLSRALLDTLEEDRHRPILIINPRLSPTQFLRTLALRLGVQVPAYFRTDLLEQIHETLFQYHEEGVCPILIVDEAQLIPGRPTFDEIRLLTNFQLDEANLLALILIGQPEVSRRLKHPAYAALRQRIGIRFHLKPLTRQETGEYVRHRLRVAGGTEDLFTPDGMEEVYRYSGGLPRVINNLASNALLAGLGRQASRIGAGIILEAARELDLRPAHASGEEGED